VKIVELPPDLRKLDGFGGAPPHSIRFLWYGGCKTDLAEPRAAGHPMALVAARGLYAPLFLAGWVRPWRIGRGGNVVLWAGVLAPRPAATAARDSIFLRMNYW